MSNKGTDKESFLQHRLRLFLSVDMVGSTPFKQGLENMMPKQGTVGPEWFSGVDLFYSEIASRFHKKWQEIKSDMGFAHKTPAAQKVSGLHKKPGLNRHAIFDRGTAIPEIASF